MKYLVAVFLTLFACGICRAEIVAVTVETAEVRSNPSLVASYVVLEAPRYYPFSVQGESGDFYEVIDYQGNNGWILKTQASDAKGVVVKVETVNIRNGPGTSYPILFKAYRGVTFSVLREKGGWLNVLHESGKRGWISKALTWGQ